MMQIMRVRGGVACNECRDLDADIFLFVGELKVYLCMDCAMQLSTMIDNEAGAYHGDQ